MSDLTSEKMYLNSGDRFFVVGAEPVTGLPEQSRSSTIRIGGVGTIKVISASSLMIESRFKDQEREINNCWSELTEEDTHQKLITNQTRLNAINILRELPLDITNPPDIGFLPNGQITLDWCGPGGDITLIVTNTHIDMGARFSTGQRMSDRIIYTSQLPLTYISDLNQILNKDI